MGLSAFVVIGRSIAFAVFVAWLGCSDVTLDAPCTDGQGRCDGQTHQVCRGGRFVDDETCAGGLVCFADFGCGECDPIIGTACVASAVHQCRPDGTVGSQLRDCGESGCSQGTCNSDCSVVGVDLIYVVDDQGMLYSFDPEKIGAQPFQEVGQLECPAGDSWPSYKGGNPAVPFSMSVDRSGLAWVLYSSGEIFWVSTVDARCVASPYVAGSAGFELFGMGFVTSGADTDDEILYIAGGDASATTVGDLGWVDPMGLAVTRVGALSATTISPVSSPELTGTGDGLLYGYYPGTQSAVVAISKASGAEIHGWELSPSQGTPRAWAFAHWGGEFYIFSTTTLGIEETSSVIKLNPIIGEESVVLPSTGIRVVGAGVSTCAPTGVE